MKPSDLSIVPATADLVARYHDGPPPFTFTGHVAMIEDRVVGLGGVFYAHGQAYAFSEMKPELRARRKDRARCFRFLEQQIGKFRGTLYAIACEPTSPRLLERLGFRPAAATTDDGFPLMVKPHA